MVYSRTWVCWCCLCIYEHVYSKVTWWAHDGHMTWRSCPTVPPSRWLEGWGWRWGWEGIKNRPNWRINHRLGHVKSLFVNNNLSSGKRKRKDKKKLTNDSRCDASRASSVVETPWMHLDPCYSHSQVLRYKKKNERRHHLSPPLTNHVITCWFASSASSESSRSSSCTTTTLTLYYKNSKGQDASNVSQQQMRLEMRRVSSHW